MKNYAAIFLFMLLMAAFPILASAADPGHGAASISAGTFEAGNFTFPNWLTITEGLRVNTSALYVDPATARVGIGTSSPAVPLDVNGAIYSRSGGIYSDIFQGYSGSDTNISTGTGGAKDLIFKTALTEKMRITSTGNVGIGTAAPGAMLDVLNTATDSGIIGKFQRNVDASGEYAYITAGSANHKAYLGTLLASADVAYFSAAANPSTGNGIFIQEGGNVGIGTAAPYTKLDVNGDALIGTQWADSALYIAGSGGYTGALASSGNDFVISNGRGSSDKIRFSTVGNADTVTIASGNVGIGTSTPNYKLDVYSNKAVTTNIAIMGNAVGASTTNYGIYTQASGATTNYGVYSAGGINYFNGNVGIGTTNPVAKLQVGTSVGFGALNDALGDLVGTTGLVFPAGSSGFSYVGSAIVSKATGSYGGNLLFGTKADNGNEIKERMRIQSDGNVGIGTTNPGDKLTVQGASVNFGNGAVTDVYSKYVTDSRAWWTGVGVTGADDGYVIYDATASKQRLVINTDGNVGIGTTTPANTLNVVGTANVTGATYLLNSKCGSGQVLKADAATGLVSCTAAVASEADPFWTAASPNVARTGNCPSGQVVQNTTTGGVQCVTPLFAETDPQVNTLTNGKWCTTDGSVVNCATNAPVLTEADPFWTANYTAYNASWSNMTNESYLKDYGDTATGNYTFDTNTLFIDSTNDRVGIGTTSPAGKLQVNGTVRVGATNINDYSQLIGTEASATGASIAYQWAIPTYGVQGRLGTTAGNAGYMDLRTTDQATIGVYLVGIGNSYFNGGNVGIGTTNPANGKLVVSRGGGVPDLEIGSDTSANAYGVGIRASGGSGSSALRLMSSVGTVQLYDASNNYVLNIYNGSTLGASLTASGNSYFNGGNVGIGTTAPGANLDVTSPANAYIRANKNGLANAGGLVLAANNTNKWYILMPGNSEDLWFYDGQGPLIPKMAINRATGNVGIGTTDPEGTLHIKSSGFVSPMVILDSTGHNSWALESCMGCGSFHLWDKTNGKFPFTVEADTSDNTLYLKGSNVGIGTTAPAQPLTVSGTGAANGVLGINVTGDAAYNWASQAIDGSLTAGHIITHIIGQELGVKNSGWVGFNYTGAGSNSNSMNIGFYGVSNPALTVQAGGNVGIGTVSPAAPLDVNGAIYSRSGGIYSDIFQGYSGSDTNISTGTGGAKDLIFKTALTEKMRITSTGNVGIGTASPSNLLDVDDGALAETAPTAAGITISGNRAGVFQALALRQRDAGGTVTTTDEGVGIYFKGLDESYSAYQNMGVITVRAEGQSVHSADSPGYMSFFTTPDGSASPTEKMRITSTGNVGIGTTAPAYTLDVQGISATANIINTGTGGNAAGGALLLGSTRTVSDGTYASYIEAMLNAQSAGHQDIAEIDFQAQGTTANQRGGKITLTTKKDGSTSFNTGLVVDNAGNVGIGTASPEVKLQVVGTPDSGATGLAHFDSYSSYSGRPSALMLRKSHSDTIGTLTTTVDGEGLGGIAFGGVTSGSNFLISSYIEAVQNGASGSGAIPTDLHFATENESAQNTDQLVLHHDGNVGIGTATPGRKLDVSADSGLAVKSSTDYSVNLNYLYGTSIASLYGMSDIGGTANLALNPAGGNVGIGTATPTSFKLQVAGNVGPDANNSYNLGSSTLRWKTIYSVNSLDSLSERQYKKNIREIDEGQMTGMLEKAKEAKLYTYQFKWENDNAGNKTAHIGVMADEAPEEIRGKEDNGSYTGGINLGNYVSFLHASLKELALEVDQLKGQNTTIQNSINLANATNLTLETIQAGNASIQNLAADSASINTLTANSLTADAVQANSMKNTDGSEKIRFENGNVYIMLGS